ncbi:MAG: hypothetical protein D8M58_11540 [Calditrichaeota bacterium]|nr:MAG: hypothetical protein DWQ03_10915 [Calditrichota bacterium]MBL1206027.1 hypothetical protein [Calditrichota bacterium]NOG45855.1 hypothetical protein [Calditrichota bacterium]
MSSDQSGDSSAKKAAMTKWIVFGVVIIVFMFLFKGEISKILDKTEEISISTDGIAIKTRTINTPLGKTVLSNKAAEFEDTSAEPVSQVYVDEDNGFQIDWPQNGKWAVNREMAGFMSTNWNANFPLYIGYYQSFGDFTPNINVLVGPTNDIPIKDWIDATNNELVQLGWEVVDTEIDEETMSGVNVMLNRDIQGSLYQVQRFLFKEGKFYMVTASKLESDTDVFPEIYEEMAFILNSFELI